MHFNGLTPAEAERLAYLIEECGEVITAATKILRHGYGSHNADAPGRGDNRVQLTREIDDALGAIARLAEAGDVLPNLNNMNPRKGQQYMHHQDFQG